MNAIGKLYAGKPLVQFDEGALETERCLAYSGTKLETAETAKAEPVRHRARALLNSHLPMPYCNSKDGQ